MPKMQERAVESAAQTKDEMKPKLKPHTVKLLRRICVEILKEPRRFNMDHYLGHQPGSPCGTSACIAGFAVVITGINGKPVTIRTLPEARRRCGYIHDLDEEGQQALKITKAQRNRLFFASDWVEPFGSKFEDAESPRERAKIAVARIKHFIKTGK